MKLMVKLSQLILNIMFSIYLILQPLCNTIETAGKDWCKTQCAICPYTWTSTRRFLVHPFLSIVKARGLFLGRKSGWDKIFSGTYKGIKKQLIIKWLYKKQRFLKLLNSIFFFMYDNTEMEIATQKGFGSHGIKYESWSFWIPSNFITKQPTFI